MFYLGALLFNMFFLDLFLMDAATFASYADANVLCSSRDSR